MAKKEAAAFVELPIAEQKKYNTYLGLTIPFCLLATIPNAVPWINERFIDIYINGNQDFMYAGYGYEQDMAAHELLEDRNLQFSADEAYKMDIPAYLMRQIREEGWYCDIRLDEFYLPTQDSYGQEHYNHSSLLYGYDQERREFLSYTITRGGRFARLRYTFEEVEQAFRSTVADQPGNIHLTLLRPKPLDAPYHFSIERFARRLTDYLNSRDLTERNYHAYIALYRRDEKAPYGVAAVQQFLGDMRQKQEWAFREFRSIHFLAEHKRGIWERLCYVCETSSPPEGFRALTSRYREVADSFEQVRLLYLKGQYLNWEDPATPARWANMRERVIRQMEENLLLEQSLLAEAVAQLQHPTRPAPDTLSEISGEAAVSMEIDTETVLYRHSLILRCRWNRPRRLDRVCVSQRSFATVWVDGEALPPLPSMEERAGEMICWRVRKTCARELTVRLLSEFPILPEETVLRVYEMSLSWQRPAAASSSWQPEDGEVFQPMTPDMAVDGEEKTYWNARPCWQPGETYLEVDLEAEMTVNAVLIAERPGNRRLKAYTVYGSGEDGAWRSLLRQQEGEPVGAFRLHRFAAATMRRLRLVVEQTLPDQYGFDEPAIGRFDVYCLPEDGC